MKLSCYHEKYFNPLKLWSLRQTNKKISRAHWRTKKISRGTLRLKGLNTSCSENYTMVLSARRRFLHACIFQQQVCMKIRSSIYITLYVCSSPLCQCKDLKKGDFCLRMREKRKRGVYVSVVTPRKNVCACAC